MDLRVQLSSCVPATDLETSGARLEVGDLIALADHPKVLGLAEFMNFPGLLKRDPPASPSSPPSRPGRSTATARCSAAIPLNGYLSAGVRTDHEVTNLPEGARKTVERHGGADPRGLGVQGPARAQRPRSPSAIRPSSPSAPTTAIRSTSPRRAISTSSSARRSNSARRRSPPIAPLASQPRASSACATAASWRPGWRADLVVVDDLESCAVSTVLARRPPRSTTPCSQRAARSTPVGRDSIKARRVEPERFRRARAGALDPGDRHRSRQDHHRARARDAALPQRRTPGRSRPGRHQGGGGRPPWRQRQHGDRLRQRLRHEARRDRLLGRARQPQPLRRRDQRGRHGRRGQPAARDRGRLRGGGRRQGRRRAAVGGRRAHEPRAASRTCASG